MFVTIRRFEEYLQRVKFEVNNLLWPNEGECSFFVFLGNVRLNVA